MIKIAVCDDEVIFAEKMKNTIASYCMERQILCEIDVYPSGKEFLTESVKIMGYQVVFLDINMEEIDGLETARMLRNICKETFIIFVTAFINYTLEGYKVDALRYLLKTSENFEQSVYESLNAVFQKMAYTPEIRTFSFRGGSRDIALEKILYVESKLHKLTFYVLEDGITSYTMYNTLNNVSEVFSKDFVRIHQSYMVNLAFVRKISRSELWLINGVSLPVARSRADEVRKRVAMYKGGL